MSQPASAALTTKSHPRFPGPHTPHPRPGRAFTLIEILIVVVILGILAAIVVPSMAKATDDASATATFSEAQKIRKHINVYKVQHNGAIPPIQNNASTWAGIVPEQLGSPPLNAWVGGDNGHKIIFGTGPDTGYHRDYGWIFDPASGYVWAAAFDGNDQPLQRIP